MIMKLSRFKPTDRRLVIHVQVLTNMYNCSTIFTMETQLKESCRGVVANRLILPAMAALALYGTLAAEADAWPTHFMHFGSKSHDKRHYHHHRKRHHPAMTSHPTEQQPQPVYPTSISAPSPESPPPQNTPQPPQFQYPDCAQGTYSPPPYTTCIPISTPEE